MKANFRFKLILRFSSTSQFYFLSQPITEPTAVIAGECSGKSTTSRKMVRNKLAFFLNA